MIGRTPEGAYTCTEHPRERLDEEGAFIHLREFHAEHLNLVASVEVEAITGRRQLRAARRAVAAQHRRQRRHR